jgi:hypothetical protein
MVAEGNAGQTQPTPWAPGRDPELFGAIQETQTVWAEKSGTDGATAGARYTLKVRAGDRFNSAQAGFGMSSELIGGQWVSDFRVLADRFAVVQNLDSAPTASHPFAIINGATYIKKAIIKDADIDTLKIAGGSVTSMNIGIRSGTLTLSTGWQFAASCSISMPSNSTGVIIQVSTSVGGQTAARQVEMEVRRNGSVLGVRSGLAQANQGPVFTYNWFDASPANGSNTYSLYVRASGAGVNMGYASISVTGGKR